MVIVKKTGTHIIAFCHIVLREINEDYCLEFMEAYLNGHIKPSWSAMVEVRENFLTDEKPLKEASRISTLFGLWNCLQINVPASRIADEVFNLPAGLKIQ